jgi:hypothetical protein
VGHLQVRQVAGPKPAKVIVFSRCEVDRFPVPAGDEERVHVESGVTDRDRKWTWILNVDPEFFEAFPPDRLMWKLARLDMPADEVPAVGIPPARWMAMRQEH